MFDPRLTLALTRQRHDAMQHAVGADRFARRTKSDRAEAVAAPSLPVAKSWTGLVGASRAVQIGSVIEVGGTGAVGGDGKVLFPGDPYRQTKEALRIVGDALREFGSGLEDVVRTRVYLKKAWQWEPIGRAHGDVFSSIRPATTFVGAGAFVDPDMLVEIEATALVRG
jgi:enamine deaminase RidA (YjgF/YER057c/UK114 family)